MKRSCALLLAVVMLAGTGCALMQDTSRPRPLKAREILRLVSRNDDLPLPVVTGATVLDVGQFAEAPVVAGPPEEAPLCPGRRYQLASHSRLVQAELLAGFGFSFVVHGEPWAGGEVPGTLGVPLVLEVEHPPVLNPVTGEVVRKDWLHIMGCVGHESDAVFQFSSDWELVSGPWTLRLLANGQELASKRFDVTGGKAPWTMTAQLPEPEPVEQAPDLRVQLSGRTSSPATQPAHAVPARQGSQTATRTPAQGKLIFVLVSSNLQKKNALVDIQRLRELGYAAELGLYHDQRRGKLWHTVRLGRYATVREAERAARHYTQRLGRKAYVVARSMDSVASEAAFEAPGQAAPPAAAELPAVSPAPKKGAQIADAYTVQVAACLEAANATGDVGRLQARGWPAQVLQRSGPKGRLWHTVVLGGYATREQAARAAASFRQREGRPALVVKTP